MTVYITCACVMYVHIYLAVYIHTPTCTTNTKTDEVTGTNIDTHTHVPQMLTYHMLHITYHVSHVLLHSMCMRVAHTLVICLCALMHIHTRTDSNPQVHRHRRTYLHMTRHIYSNIQLYIHICILYTCNHIYTHTKTSLQTQMTTRIIVAKILERTAPTNAQPAALLNRLSST